MSLWSRGRSGVRAARDLGILGVELNRSWRRRYWTREQVQRHQERALRDLRAYTYARSPFYQQFHKGLMDRPLEELPVLTKANMMEHFDELVTDRSVRLADVENHVKKVVASGYVDEELLLGRYFVNETSGSSGLRGLFLHDMSELIILVATFMRAQRMTGAGINWYLRPRVAMVAANNPLGIVANVHRFGRPYRDRTLHLNTVDPIGSLVQQLNDYQPSALVIYGRMAGVMAEAQRAGDLRISPKVVVSSAEILTDSGRRSVEESWGAPVTNIYGATETGNLASECSRQRGMHLLDDLVIVENVDKDNRPVPPGEYGDKLLITVLFRKTQPLIRYELSDSVRFAREPCACGRSYPLIDDIQGRLWDVLYFDTPSGGKVPIHPRVLNRVLERYPAEWQVIQEASGLRVLISYVHGAVDEADLADKLRQVILAQGAADVPIVIERVPEIPKAAGGKTPLILSRIPQLPRSG